MFGDDILVRTLLVPPRLPRRWLARDRLDRLLSGIVEYPLTIVTASAGYGKSTALAAFAAAQAFPFAWYTLGEGCDDPLVFLVHLVHACRTLAPSAHIGERALAILQHGGSGPQVWAQSLDSLLNDLVDALGRETILILDDYHTVDDQPDIRALVERLVTMRPALLHIMLASRRRPQLTCIPTLQVRGELFEISEQDLAFTPAEIAQLFSSAYGRDLNPDEAPLVREQTGGWAIALQLVWQSRPPFQRSGDPAPEHAALSTGGREALFAYLAQEVLARQPRDIQSFLLRSSVLSELDPAACDHVLGITSSEAQLSSLYRRGLFLTSLGDGVYRYHPLFHSFLQEHATATLPEWSSLHVRAADYYRRMGAGEQVLYHLLASGDVSGAALELERSVPAWIESGRLVTLLAWLEQLPVNVLEQRPVLLLARGDAARLMSRFDEALQSYKQAKRIYEGRADPPGTARALRGEAVVYLDTVEPVRAEALLRQAFKLLPEGESTARAELLALIAENRLNRGRAGQALRLYTIAAGLDPSRRGNAVGAAPPRVLLHLGRLAEARALLEAALPRDRASISQGRPYEPHREVTLLLSSIAQLEGDPVAALRYAEEGLEAARRLGSTLFEADACICAGHAVQLARPGDYRAANEYYLQAMSLAGASHVQSSGAEAFMGLALLHGFRGDLAAAEAAARQGLAIVDQSGDEWTAARLWTALGAVGVANAAPEARGWLDQALDHYRTSKDTYGQAVVHLWSSVRHRRAGNAQEAARRALDAFDLAQQHGYHGLLTAPTLFGPRDRMMLVPVLLAARDNPQWGGAAQMLLSRGFPGIAADETTRSYHPGVTLRVHTLGPLRVWRGNEEIGPHEWQRKKAQQMLALLLTNRHRWLLREQICDWLWPEDEASDAEAQFKVTLNGLNAALEPLRPPRTPPFYIRRQGGAYRFCPPDGVWLDVDEFETRLAAARASHNRDDARTEEQGDGTLEDDLSIAVELHQGEYLSDWLYEDWARDERERLEARYLEAATLLAETLLDRNEPSEAIRLCESVLARDRAWEDAYCVLMRAYSMQGQRRMVQATYERCVRNLREFMDLDPLPSTVRLYEAAMA